jgi:hypothetical protein
MPATTHDTVRLYGWEPNWAQAKRPVLALLFGHMVRRATPVMHEYQSDLYHDALWLEQHCVPGTSFDWLVRPSGTNLSTHPDTHQNCAHIGVRIGAGPGAVLYRVTLRDDGDGQYFADFTEVPFEQIKSA